MKRITLAGVAVAITLASGLLGCQKIPDDSSASTHVIREYVPQTATATIPPITLALSDVSDQKYLPDGRISSYVDNRTGRTCRVSYKGSSSQVRCQ